MSAAIDKAKAAQFVCSRVGALLSHLASNANAKNAKELIRVLMPFVQGALVGFEDPVTWLLEDCQVLHCLFESIVHDEEAV